jgi:hypothetical protein
VITVGCTVTLPRRWQVFQALDADKARLGDDGAIVRYRDDGWYMSQARVLAHEFGHVVGNDDIDQVKRPNRRTDLMNGVIGDGHDDLDQKECVKFSDFNPQKTSKAMLVIKAYTWTLCRGAPRLHDDLTDGAAESTGKRSILNLPHDKFVLVSDL